jgi:hypothetical protein
MTFGHRSRFGPGIILSDHVTASPIPSEDLAMNVLANPARRTLLKNLSIGLSLAPLAAAANSAEVPLLSETDPAKAVQYVADASNAKEAQSGANCSNCSIYGGSSGNPQGSCTLFPGKLVKAAGWCNAWSNM